MLYRNLGKEALIVVWLTGLSSAGKSTIAEELTRRLTEAGHRVEWLDADIVRRQLWPELGFTKRDRDANVERIGSIAELISKHGIIVVVSAISPYRDVRDRLRNRIPGFLEIYVNAPLEVCECRYVKSLYRKARAGDIRGFTGIDDPYEAPLSPEIECKTDFETVVESVQKILDHVTKMLPQFGTAARDLRPLDCQVWNRQDRRSSSP